MKTAIIVIQILLSILLITTILLQSRGSGMSSAFGGGGESYRSRRGIEKILLRLTAIVALLFLASSIINTLIK